MPAQRDAHSAAGGEWRVPAAGCALLGLAALYAPVLLLRARKFALLWSLGSALALAGEAHYCAAAQRVDACCAARKAPSRPALLYGRSRWKRDAVRRAVSAGTLLTALGAHKSPHCWPRCWACFPAARAPLCASRSGAWAQAPPSPRRSPFEARGPRRKDAESVPRMRHREDTGNQLWAKASQTKDCACQFPDAGVEAAPLLCQRTVN